MGLRCRYDSYESTMHYHSSNGSVPSIISTLGIVHFDLSWQATEVKCKCEPDRRVGTKGTDDATRLEISEA